jgi:nitroreductase
MDFSKETIFTEARSHKKFDGKALSSDDMRAIYELTKLAPTANNSCPLRIVFVNTIESMERLAACALDFYTRFHYLAPHMKQPVAHASWPVERIERYALANANLQAGFLIAAARALGFDCGPMGGFDAPAVESQFFDEKSWRFSCVILLGHGDPSAIHPRAPRLDFDDACRII